MHVEKLTPEQWLALSGYAHQAVFGKQKDPFAERITYAWLVVEGDKPVSYITVLELDSDTAYWQFGGAFPWAWNSRAVTKSYDLCIQAQEKLSKRFATRIENTNTPMLKLALSRGFLPVGLRTYQGTILLELVRESNHAVSSDSAGNHGRHDAALAVAAEPAERERP
ncbi:MAG: hypothetical protein HC841_00265 [Verrucomicrobiae bacterium]|nr:hypothetical protein [Verrucomicrobiae bacterium]